MTSPRPARVPARAPGPRHRRGARSRPLAALADLPPGALLRVSPRRPGRAPRAHRGGHRGHRGPLPAHGGAAVASGRSTAASCAARCTGAASTCATGEVVVLPHDRRPGRRRRCRTRRGRPPGSEPKPAAIGRQGPGACADARAPPALLPAARPRRTPSRSRCRGERARGRWHCALATGPRLDGRHLPAVAQPGLKVSDGCVRGRAGARTWPTRVAGYAVLRLRCIDPRSAEPAWAGRSRLSATALSRWADARSSTASVDRGAPGVRAGADRPGHRRGLRRDRDGDRPGHRVGLRARSPRDAPVAAASGARAPGDRGRLLHAQDHHAVAGGRGGLGVHDGRPSTMRRPAIVAASGAQSSCRNSGHSVATTTTSRAAAGGLRAAASLDHHRRPRRRGSVARVPRTVATGRRRAPSRRAPRAAGQAAAPVTRAGRPCRP